MGYIHIEILDKTSPLWLFKECYATEKIHGTTSHISWNNNISFHNGAADHEEFRELFDRHFLEKKLEEHFGRYQAVIYGESYGGKLQGMSETYGDRLRFIVFDVFVCNRRWLTVQEAATLAKDLHLDFVPFEIIPVSVEAIEEACHKPSVQSLSVGRIGEHLREGVVLRPLKECYVESASSLPVRVIAKHKRHEFSERTTPLEIGQRLDLTDPEAIAQEWVTERRMDHVLDKVFLPFIAANAFGLCYQENNTGAVIKAMLEDIFRESHGEVVDSEEVRKAISKVAAYKFQSRIFNKRSGL